MTKLNGKTFLANESLNNSNHHVTVKNPLRDDAFNIDDTLNGIDSREV